MKFFRKTVAVGFDISDRSLRFVKLERRGTVLRIAAFRERPLPEGIVENGVILKPEDMVAHTKELFRNERHREVIVCLPERQSFVKTILVHPNHHDLHERILKEVRQHLPYTPEEVILDSQILAERPTGLTHSLEVLFSAAPKKIIAQYEDVLLASGLLPVALEVESIALARALIRPDDEQGTLLLIDCGTSVTSFVVVDHGVIQLTLGLGTFSGASLDEAIAKGLSISPADAEKKKISHGFDDSAVRSACEKEYRALLKEIESILSYFESHNPGRNVTSLVWTGSASQVKGLMPSVQEQCKLPSAAGDPAFYLAKVKHPIAELKMPSFTTAIGLALRSFS